MLLTVSQKMLYRQAMSSGDVPALRVEGASVRFGGVTALDGVSLSVARGEVRGLIGPNGAGKTTLFDLISGLLRPDDGRVYLGPADVTARSATARARAGLRRTFQRQQVFGSLSVEDNLLAAQEWRGGGGGLLADLVASPTRRSRERTRRQRVAEVMEQCGLTPVRRSIAGTLPIGLARMVELGRALVDSPTVLLLDEPTSGLDDTEAARLGEAIALVSAGGCSVVLVEHDVGFVMAHCHRVLVLHLGLVLADGAPVDVQANVAVRAAYLG